MNWVVSKPHDCTGSPLFMGRNRLGRLNGWWHTIAMAFVFEKSEAETEASRAGCGVLAVQVKLKYVVEKGPSWWGKTQTNKWGWVPSILCAHQYSSQRNCSRAVTRLREKGNVGIFVRKIAVETIP